MYRQPFSRLIASAIHGSDEAPSRVPLLSPSGLQSALSSSNKFILLLHASGCERGEAFAPTLARLALQVPGLSYGRVDADLHPKSGVSVDGEQQFLQFGAPVLKAFIRAGPMAHHKVEYGGVCTESAVLEWLRAVNEISYDKLAAAHQRARTRVAERTRGRSARVGKLDEDDEFLASMEPSVPTGTGTGTGTGAGDEELPHLLWQLARVSTVKHAAT